MQEDFRLAVKRTRPKNLQDAVTAAMQEECIRMSEDQKFPTNRINRRPIYNVRLDQHNNDSMQSHLNDNNAKSSRDLSNDGRAQNLKTCYKCKSSEHLYGSCPWRNIYEDGRTGSRPYVTGTG